MSLRQFPPMQNGASAQERFNGLIAAGIDRIGSSDSSPMIKGNGVVHLYSNFLERTSLAGGAYFDYAAVIFEPFDNSGVANQTIISRHEKTYPTEVVSVLTASFKVPSASEIRKINQLYDRKSEVSSVLSILESCGIVYFDERKYDEQIEETLVELINEVSTK